MGSRTRHSSGRKAASRPARRGRSTDSENTLLAVRDQLNTVKAIAIVVLRSLTAEDGDPNAATALMEGVCYPLTEVIGRLDSLSAAVQCTPQEETGEPHRTLWVRRPKR